MKRFLIICVLLFFPYMTFAEWSMPSTRMGSWSIAGVDGGIPSRVYDGGTDDINVTASPYNVDNTGTSSAVSGINSAITDCNADGDCDVVYLPNGTYLIDGTVVMKSGVTLRGQSNDSSSGAKLNVTTGIGIRIGSSYTMGGVNDDNYHDKINISSGYTRGSTSIVMASDPSGSFSVGDIAVVCQLDSGNSLINGTACTQDKFGLDPGSAPRSIGQTVEITDITSNTITFEPALTYTYESGYDPELWTVDRTSVTEIISYAGVENMYLYRTGEPSGSPFPAAHIWINRSMNNWVTECELYLCYRRLIKLSGTYRCYIENNYLHESTSYSSGGLGYLFDIGYYSSSCLVENNIILYGNETIQMNNPGPNNVIAYNYADGSVNQTAGWQNFTCGVHCAHPMFNLIEGNQLAKFGNDGFWGSSSHYTVFRNHLRTDDIYPLDDTRTDDIQPLAGIDHSRFSYLTIIGNVIGQSSFPHNDSWTGYQWENASHSPSGNRHVYYSTQTDDDINGLNTMIKHGNYDYYNIDVIWCNETGGDCQGGSQDQDLPDSLYLTSKPSWWDDQGAGRPWPPIGPDINGYIVDIPAKDRFENEIWSNSNISIDGGSRTMTIGGAQTLTAK